LVLIKWRRIIITANQNVDDCEQNKWRSWIQCQNVWCTIKFYDLKTHSIRKPLHYTTWLKNDRVAKEKLVLRKLLTSLNLKLIAEKYSVWLIWKSASSWKQNWQRN
jgi:hypothetical protein